MHWTGVDCLTDWQTIGGIGKSFRLRVEDVLGFPRDFGSINLLDAVHLDLVLVVVEENSRKGNLRTLDTAFPS